MSLRYEQYNALKTTREFLRSILDGSAPSKKVDLRDKAYHCLRHFPFLHDNGQPIFSKDEFTIDEKD